MHKKNILIISILTVFLLTLAVTFLPYFAAKSFAESKVKNATQIVKTEEYNAQNMAKFFSPEYVIYSKTDNIDQSIYIKLKRVNLILWDVAETKIQSGDIQAIENSLREDKITPKDFSSGIDPKAIKDTAPNYAPGSSINDITTLSGDKIQVILANNQQDNDLHLNGKALGIKNVYSVCLSLDEKYIYYSKFSTQTLPDGFMITTPDAKIYRYDSRNKSEELVFAFSTGTSISFKVNANVIFYATDQNEVGKIDLESKQKIMFNTAQLNMNLDVQVNGDIGKYTPISIVNVDAETGILEVKLPGQEPKYFRISLQNMRLL